MHPVPMRHAVRGGVSDCPICLKSVAVLLSSLSRYLRVSTKVARILGCPRRGPASSMASAARSWAVFCPGDVSIPRHQRVS